MARGVRALPQRPGPAWRGHAGTGTKACGPGSGPSKASGRAAKGVQEAGRGAGVCGTLDTGPRPGSEACSGSIPGAARRGGRGRGGGARRASCLGEGTAKRAGHSPAFERAARRPPASQEPRCPAAPRPGDPGGAMDRGRGKRSRGARTCCCLGRERGTWEL